MPDELAKTQAIMLDLLATADILHANSQAAAALTDTERIAWNDRANQLRTALQNHFNAVQAQKTPP
jgi:hypothetical protein